MVAEQNETAISKLKTHAFFILYMCIDVYIHVVTKRNNYMPDMIHKVLELHLLKCIRLFFWFSTILTSVCFQFL